MVQRYVLGLLTEEETASIQAQLIFNKQLRQEVDLFRTVRKELGVNMLHAPAPTRRLLNTPVLIVGALLMAGLIGFGVSQFTGKAKPATAPAPAAVQPSEPVAAAPATPTGSAAAKAGMVAEAETPIAATAQQAVVETVENQAAVKDTGAPALLAQLDPADYAPYPYLEQMTSGMRGDEGVITLFKPINGQQFKGASEKIVLPFEGTISSRKQPYDFHLAIYSNKQRDFETDSPVLRTKVPLEKVSEGNWNFAMQTSVRLKPGLYYFILTTREGTMTTVSKFTVHP